MTAGWTPDDWYNALLDVGLAYEDELRELSVQTFEALLAYPLGCIAGVILSHLLWTRNLGFYMPFIGRLNDGASKLIWACMTIAAVTAESNIALAGYAKPSFSDGFFAALDSGILFASSTLQVIPAIGAFFYLAVSITLIRIILLVARTGKKGCGSPFPVIVFGIRSRLRMLALVLQILMLLSVMGVIPAIRAARPTIDADSESKVMQMANSDVSLSHQDWQDAINQLQIAVCVEAPKMGIGSEDTPHVLTTIIPDENICAAYRPFDNAIIINTLWLHGKGSASRSSLLFAGFHELYHCRQYLYVRGRPSSNESGSLGPDANTIKRWAREMRWYVVLSTSSSRYYNLEIERSANHYASIMLDYYQHNHAT